MMSIICAIPIQCLFLEGGGGEGRRPNILAEKWSINQEHISEVKKA